MLIFGLLGLTGCSRSAEEVHSPSEVKMRIKLHTETPMIRSGMIPRFVVHLVNDCAEPITVVLPGDGSLAGERTPIVRWNPPIQLREGCGTKDPLRADELVTIRAGESYPIKNLWISQPDLKAAGTHQVSVELENAPDL